MFRTVEPAAWASSSILKADIPPYLSPGSAFPAMLPAPTPEAPEPSRVRRGCRAGLFVSGPAWGRFQPLLVPLGESAPVQVVFDAHVRHAEHDPEPDDRDDRRCDHVRHGVGMRFRRENRIPRVVEPDPPVKSG